MLTLDTVNHQLLELTKKYSTKLASPKGTLTLKSQVDIYSEFMNKVIGTQLTLQNSINDTAFKDKLQSELKLSLRSNSDGTVIQMPPLLGFTIYQDTHPVDDTSVTTMRVGWTDGGSYTFPYDTSVQELIQAGIAESLSKEIVTSLQLNEAYPNNKLIQIAIHKARSKK